MSGARENGDWGTCLRLGKKMHPRVCGRDPWLWVWRQVASGCHGAVGGARGGALGVRVQIISGTPEQTQLSRDTADLERETVFTNRVFMANRKASAVCDRKFRDEPPEVNAP